MIAYLVSMALAAAAADANRTDLSKEQSREVMRDFARCMAKYHEKDARQIVETNPDSPVAKDLHKLMRPDCMPRSFVRLALRGKTTHYRYALAEGLLHRSFDSSPPAGLATAPPLEHPALALGAPMPAGWSGDPAKWSESVAASQGYAYVSAFGECLVRTAPDLSWALLRTEVVSKDEDAAFAALSSAMSGCVAKDQKVELNKFNVRGSIALNIYRLVHAQGVATSARGSAE